MNPALPEDKSAYRAIFFKRFLALLVLSVIITSAGMVVLYAIESKAVQTELESASHTLATLHKKHLEGLVWQVQSDLTYLAAMAETFGATQKGDNFTNDRLSHLYGLFLREKPLYDQIRIINTSGREVLRINLGPDGPVPVPQEKLQDKSGRDYVQATLRLSRGEIYVSRLDLNIEHGSIEMPPKPVLRFATPVFTAGGRMQGFVILNLLGSTLFRDMTATEIKKEVQTPLPMNTMMLDAEGYWVYNPLEPGEEYGFMYPDKQRMTMATEIPEAWKVLLTTSEGKYLGSDGLYVYETLDILQEGTGIVKGPGHPWKIAVFTSTPSLAAVYGNLQKKFLVPFSALVVLLAIVCWSLAEAQVHSRFAEAKIAHLAHHDHLTGLANRLLFNDLAELAISTAERNRRQLALLFMDLDRFKHINDALGHAAGDEALRITAKRIQDCIRRPDVAARLGGDEFAVILQDINGESGALTVARKLIDAATTPFLIKGVEQRVGASIGISLYPQNGRDIDTLLKLADSAMYRAKSSGGNRAEVVSFDHR